MSKKKLNEWVKDKQFYRGASLLKKVSKEFFFKARKKNHKK